MERPTPGLKKTYPARLLLSWRFTGMAAQRLEAWQCNNFAAIWG
jgi:hypothetical protein